MTEEPQSKVALVTGGSGGLGKAIVAALSSDGYEVAVHYATAKETAESVVAHLPNPAIAVRGDVRRWDDVKAMEATVRAGLGSVGLLVNCAAIRCDSLMATQSPREWKDVIDVNLVGTFLVTRAFLPGMMRRRSGAIVNLVSPAAFVGSPGQTAYAASKAAVVAMTRSLALECAPRGVTVNAVSPGFVETEMTRNVRSETRKVLLDATPSGRFALPEEVANAVLFFARARSVTGQTLHVDGGLIAALKERI